LPQTRPDVQSFDFIKKNNLPSLGNIVPKDLHPINYYAPSHLSQLEKISAHLKLPLLTGKTRHEEREKLYGDFKAGRLRALVVSKVANFAVDLPDANVMIEISGMFGSRQEEAQRLGRILRPKHRPSHFYTLVSRGTDEQRFAVNRQIFLVEQGYKYRIRYEEP